MATLKVLQTAAVTHTARGNGLFLDVKSLTVPDYDVVVRAVVFYRFRMAPGCADPVIDVTGSLVLPCPRVRMSLGARERSAAAETQVVREVKGQSILVLASVGSATTSSLRTFENRAEQLNSIARQYPDYGIPAFLASGVHRVVGCSWYLASMEADGC